eukprot:1159825-Pelagomonas_calceolata.AAC.7
MFLPDWCPAQALLRNLRALKSLNGVSGIAVDIYWLVARLSLCLRTRKTTFYLQEEVSLSSLWSRLSHCPLGAQRIESSSIAAPEQLEQAGTDR